MKGNHIFTQIIFNSLNSLTKDLLLYNTNRNEKLEKIIGKSFLNEMNEKSFVIMKDKWIQTFVAKN